MTLDPQPGTRIDQYVLDEYVGGGSFGAVWRGHDDAGQTVAVKFLTGSLASAGAGMRADLEMLAATAASNSEHVVKMLGGGSNPVPYIVMEYIQGTDLQTVLREEGTLSPQRTVEAGLAIADALRALGNAGIIHRDIKPANVVIDHGGTIKLADFGIATVVGYQTANAADESAMTMAYAAPEMWQQDGHFGPPTHRSDLYALGALLFQCLLGFTPFSGNHAELFRAHRELHPALEALPAGTPATLRVLIRRCLLKSPYDRPADAAECLQLLRRARAELDEASGATSREPRRFGPWLVDAPHDAVAWAWRCHHETTAERATVEMHFTDRLEYGATLRKALTENSALVMLGAERLIETNRLLLHPNEAWSEPPAGQFQFWVAREDAAVTSAPAVTVPLLQNAVLRLHALLSAAQGRGLALDSGHENLAVQTDGGVYLRRPGISTPAADNPDAPLQALLSLPLDSASRTMVEAAPSFAALYRDFTGAGPATVLDDSTRLVAREEGTVLVQRPVPSSQPAVPAGPAFDIDLRPGATPNEYTLNIYNNRREPLTIELDAYDDAQALAVVIPQQVVVPGDGSQRVSLHVEPRKTSLFGSTTARFRVFALLSGGSAPPVSAGATFTQKASKLPVYAGAGVVAVVVIGALALLLGGGGGDNKAQATPEAHEVAKSEEPARNPAAVTPSVPAAQPNNPPPTDRRGLERRVSFVSAQNVESDCNDGSGGCRYAYSVGPWIFRDNTVRIEFTVQVVAPPGKSLSWLDDISAHEREVKEGRVGVVVWGETDNAWPIRRAGGIASETHDVLAPGQYSGWWEFEFDEPAGSELTFDYPDFENYIYVIIPP
jgi:hypothetical protein